MGVRRIGAVALAAMLAVGLGACGDDGDDGDDVALEDVDGSDGSSDDTSDDSSDDSSDNSSDDSSDDSDGDLGAFGSEECQEIFGALSGIGGAFTDTSGEFDFSSLADLFDAIDAPDIEDELGVLADAYRDLDDAVGDVDLSDPSVFTSAEFQEAAASLNTAEFAEASERVSTFMEETCGTSG